MLAWMIYAALVTLVLSLAALCAGHAQRLRGRMTRWVWLGALVASLIVPAAIACVSIQVPAVVSGMPQAAVPLRNLTWLAVPGLQQLTPWPPAAASRSVAAAGSGRGVAAPVSLDAALERLWVLTSALLLCVLLGSAAKLAVRARGWRLVQLEGVPVYIAAGAGPAVVGLFRPRIVLPPWVLEAEPERQRLVLAHERAHLEARDPLVLTIALGLLVFMPWNLPLWWQLRQLRRAIEVDCDARVLRGGHDARRYGEALIEAGEHPSGGVGAVAAMAEHRACIQQRLRIMTRARGRWWKLSAATLGGLSVCLLALAVQVSPPPRSAGGAYSPYDDYVGAYRVAGLISYAVRHGAKLYLKLSSWDQEMELLPLGPAEFFSKELQGDVDFKLDARGRATALTLRQSNGSSATWPRLGDATAQALESALRARVQSQRPAPGSEAALAKHWASMLAGNPNYDDMTVQLAGVVREQVQQDLALAQHVGAIRSVRFIGVGFQGQDVYELSLEHETLTAEILLTPDGKTESLGITVAPVQGRPPLPGSEAAIAKYWASLAAGRPDYEDMTPVLADAVRQQLPRQRVMAQRLGAIRALRFRGVSKMGEDVYDAVYGDGHIMTWHVITDPDGKLTSSYMRQGPGP